MEDSHNQRNQMIKVLLNNLKVYQSDEWYLAVKTDDSWWWWLDNWWQLIVPDLLSVKTLLPVIITVFITPSSSSSASSSCLSTNLILPLAELWSLKKLRIRYFICFAVKITCITYIHLPSKYFWIISPEATISMTCQKITIRSDIKREDPALVSINSFSLDTSLEISWEDSACDRSIVQLPWNNLSISFQELISYYLKQIIIKVSKKRLNLLLPRWYLKQDIIEFAEILIESTWSQQDNSQFASLHTTARKVSSSTESLWYNCDQPFKSQSFLKFNGLFEVFYVDTKY